MQKLKNIIESKLLKRRIFKKNIFRNITEDNSVEKVFMQRIKNELCNNFEIKGMNITNLNVSLDLSVVKIRLNVDSRVSAR